MKYIKKFDNKGQYDTYMSGLTNNDFLPNLSLLSDTMKTEITPIDWSQRYLTVEAVDDCVFTFDVPYGALRYSLDNGETWSEESGHIYDITVNAGNAVLLKGSGACCDANEYNTIIMTEDVQKFNLMGNIMSLIYGDNFIGEKNFPDDSYGQFNFAFRESNVVDAGNLVLPVTALTSYCYERMFIHSNFLTKAPTLPAATLASSCYNEMFSSCPNLRYVKCLATDISAGGTSSWLYGVSDAGVFVKAENMASWSIGNSGIPTGWTVQNA